MAPTASDPSSNEHLRVRLSVTPTSDAGCALLEAGDRGTVTMHDPPRPDDERCTVETTTGRASTPRLLETETTERCVCRVFSDHDCLASVEGFDGRSLAVALAVSDREELSTVVAALREAGASVRLRRIADSSVDTGRRMLELDANGVTEKQREAVRAAVRAGYYETPREADLADLAAELDVSRSAVSQRLTAVEAKLVEELFRVDATDAGPQPSDAAGD